MTGESTTKETIQVLYCIYTPALGPSSAYTSAHLHAHRMVQHRTTHQVGTWLSSG